MRSITSVVDRTNGTSPSVQTATDEPQPVAVANIKALIRQIAIFFIFARLPLTHDVSLFIGDRLLHGQPPRLKRLDIKVSLL